MKKSHTFSALIIVKGRKDHLLNVLTGIDMSTRKPHEIIVVHMNESTYELPALSVPIIQATLDLPEPLPLAAARNRAASLATTGNLIFLDVDCIPDKTCFETLLKESKSEAINMLNPLYLSTTITEFDFKNLEKNAKSSPARQNLTYGQSTNYELFWSLGFFVTKSIFDRIGGFDESFKGYGGEDTDFAFEARDKKIPLIYTHAKIYHQTHSSYDPPLNWFADIICNAEIFYAKWGIWPMQGWLNSFIASGYITIGTSSITIHRFPTEDEIKRVQR